MEMGLLKGVATGAGTVGAIGGLIGALALATGYTGPTIITSNAGLAIPPHMFTVDGFDRYAYNRSKAQIRAEFGSPDSVDESDDSWFYSSVNPSLAVTDPSAGTRVLVDIRFVGFGDAQSDTVASVSH
jgi:hypothetical protein